MRLDHTLADHARAAGAKLQERTNVTGPVRDERTGRVVGVHAPRSTASAASTYRAPVVIAADGVSARLATAMGLEKRMDRPMGVAVRTYFRTPRHDDPWMESHLELWDGEPGKSTCMPGYGWIFSLGDGTANVGLGSVASTAARDEGRLQGAVRHVDGATRPPSGSSRPTTRSDPVTRRRAADGLQPRAALRQRPACSSATPPG